MLAVSRIRDTREQRNVPKKKKNIISSRRTRFELARAEHNGLAGHHLNHSVTCASTTAGHQPLLINASTILMRADRGGRGRKGRRAALRLPAHNRRRGRRRRRRRRAKGVAGVRVLLSAVLPWPPVSAAPRSRTRSWRSALVDSVEGSGRRLRSAPASPCSGRGVLENDGVAFVSPVLASFENTHTHTHTHTHKTHTHTHSPPREEADGSVAEAA